LIPCEFCFLLLSVPWHQVVVDPRVRNCNVNETQTQLNEVLLETVSVCKRECFPELVMSINSTHSFVIFLIGS
jgi:hypothetical protein